MSKASEQGLAHSIMLTTGRQILKALVDRGYVAVFAGGCVRDRLLGVIPKDYDIATSATPEEVMKVAVSHRWHCVPTGIDHGTVTVIVHTASYEITTLRRDVQTDGRHAKVEFKNATLEDDAKRRDFTVNALFEDIDGNVLDYIGGRKDISTNTLRFVGEPGSRIREDYLRILRFYRFWSRFGFVADVASRKACQQFASGLRQISVERISSEVWGILSGRSAQTVLEAMTEDQVLPFTYLTPAMLPHNWQYFDALNTLPNDHPAIRSWACLMLITGLYSGDPSDLEKANTLARTLKWSEHERRTLQSLISGWCSVETLGRSNHEKMAFIDSLEDHSKSHKTNQMTFLNFYYPILNLLVSVRRDQLREAQLNGLKALEEGQRDLRLSTPPVNGDDVLKLRPDLKGPAIAIALNLLLHAYRDRVWASRDEGLRYLSQIKV